MVIDCLALCLEISPNKGKTEQLLMKELNVNMDSTKGRQENDHFMINQIKERQNRDYLPTMQIDGTIEFKP